MQRDNINVILCDNIDSTLKNITNIFDVVKADKDNKISFSAVVFINGIEWNVKSFALYYFIEKVEDSKCAFIGSSEFFNSEEDTETSRGKVLKGTHANMGQSIDAMSFKSVYVPGPGTYELQIYKYDDESMVNLFEKNLDERLEYAIDDKLVAAYTFEVE